MLILKRVDAYRNTIGAIVLGISAVTAFPQSPPQKKELAPVTAIADRRMVVNTPQGDGLLPLYVSLEWDKPQPEITHALVIFHGAARNAVDYNHSGETAIATSGLGKETVLIAPQFLGEQDVKAFELSADILRWKHDAWEGGSDAAGPAPISSFDAIDTILKHLADKTIFPHLKIVVLAGHSGGGQIVQRYAVVGHGEEVLIREGVHVRYVVANPSSYVYFDDKRPSPGGGFAPYPAAECPKFNHWKYGLLDTPRYIGNLSPKIIEDRYVMRDVIYLLGSSDIDPEHNDIDRSCSGEAEGPYRFVRGTSYFRYLEMRHPGGIQQRVWDVPGVGHDNYKMFNSSCGLAALFDVGTCTTPGK